MSRVASWVAVRSCTTPSIGVRASDPTCSANRYEPRRTRPAQAFNPRSGRSCPLRRPVGKVIDEFPVVTASAPADLQDSLSNAAGRATDVLTWRNGDIGTGPNQVRVGLRYLTAIAPVVIFLDEFDQ